MKYSHSYSFCAKYSNYQPCLNLQLPSPHYHNVIEQMSKKNSTYSVVCDMKDNTINPSINILSTCKLYHDKILVHIKIYGYSIIYPIIEMRPTTQDKVKATKLCHEQL